MAKRTRRGNDEGTVRHRSDGRWEARIMLADGTRKSIYGKTRANVRAKMAEAKRRVDRGENVGAKSVKTADYLERWLTDVVAGSVRESTLHAYRNWVVNHLALPRAQGGIGDIPLDKLTPDDVQRMLTARKATGLSATSIDRIRSTLRIALNQAVKWGRISRNAAALARAPKRERFEIQPLSTIEVRTFLAANRDHRLMNLFTLAVMTGMRQGELLALRWQDVDLDERCVRVRATLGQRDGTPALLPPKSEMSRRTLRLSPTSVNALRAQQRLQVDQRLLAGDRWQDWNLVFASAVGTPLNASNVTHEFQVALAAAGVRRVRFHDLRHSAATFLIESGVPMRLVQDQLGHSGLALTIATYTHISAAMKQEAADAMEALGLASDAT